MKEKALESNNTSMFYKAVKLFQDHDKPPDWDVRQLFPGKTDGEAAEAVAEYFDAISHEFSPISERTLENDAEIWQFQPSEVADMLRTSKKPRSRVGGDIFPDLISPNADILAIPLTFIYNQILSSRYWPHHWKEETVVIIPKTQMPENLAQCRNLSCTMFFSKILERFIFSRLTGETELSPTQYGRRKKCGVDHMLVDMWDTILTDLDGGGRQCLMPHQPRLRRGVQ